MKVKDKENATSWDDTVTWKDCLTDVKTKGQSIDEKPFWSKEYAQCTCSV
jgi:hypothetical protein